MGGVSTYEDSTPLAQNRAQDETLSSQNRVENSPLIVDITKENEKRVSMLHKGMLINPDGTLTRTPQYETWNKNNNIQLRNIHESIPVMPEMITQFYHPKPSLLKLDWTHDGEWVLIPVDREDKGPDFKNYRLGRVERYIDLDGKIKRALSYGEEDIKLRVWFKLEEMFQAYPLWKIPQPCRYYNGRRFNLETRRPPGSKSAPAPKSSQEPIDQSQDIQGKKGNKKQQQYRGRGRGAGHYQPRGGRISTSRGGGRSTHRDSGWERDNREWDEQQSSSSGTHTGENRWEEDPWTDHQRDNEPRPQKKLL